LPFRPRGENALQQDRIQAAQDARCEPVTELVKLAGVGQPPEIWQMSKTPPGPLLRQKLAEQIAGASRRQQQQ
jgi:hypothetical protein